MKALLRRYLPWGMAVVLILVSVSAWRERLEILRLERTGLTPQSRSDLQSRLWMLEKRNRSLSAELDALRRRSGALSASDRLPSTSPADASGRTRTIAAATGDTFTPFEHAMLSILADPQLEKTWMTQQDSQLQQKYGDLFKQLNLSPEVAARFRSLLLDRQMAMFDVLAAVQEQGLSGPDAQAAIHQLLGDTQRQINGNIRDLLGAAEFRQYSSYARTIPQRSEVAQLQVALQQSGDPLQQFQSAQLVNILTQNAAVQQRAARASGSKIVRVVVPGTSLTGLVSSVPISESAITAAQGILTPAQLHALQQLQQEQQAQQIIRELARQSRAASASSSGG